MSLRNKIATAAIVADSINNPPTHIVTRVADYDKAPTNNAFIRFDSSISRLAVKFDTGGAGIGTIPYKVSIPYRVYGTPGYSAISVGIRKASDDSFQLIAEYGIEGKNNGFNVSEIVVQGANDYEMVADDKLSIEYPSNDTDGIEIATGTGAISGFTSQSYDGSYSTTSNPIAVRIVAKKLVAI